MKHRFLRPLATRILPAILGLLTALPLEAKYDLRAMEALEEKIASVTKRAKECTVALTHPMGAGQASGSAVIVGKNGLLLTAAHVVGEAKTVDVTFSDGRRAKAKVLGADYDHDVAMALITEPGDYPFMELGDSGKIRVGDPVVALGHPGGFDPKRQPPVRFGRVFEVDHQKNIRSDCTLVGGDSGGPLFDIEGRLVGIHSSVGMDMSINNDVPLAVLKAGWERMVMGERWGKNRAESPKMNPEELAGLDLQKFKNKVMEEASRNKGMLAADPAAIASWLKESGMKEDKVQKMDPGALVAFVQKALGGMGKVEARAQALGPLPEIPEAERGGLDVAKFRQRILDDGMKSGGKLALSPAAVRDQLKACGMKEERLGAMSDMDVVAMLQKVLGGLGRAHATDETNKAELEALAKNPAFEGLDAGKLQKRILEDAAKNSGKVEASPDRVAAWLKECGMKEEKVKALTPQQFGEVIKKALGGAMAMQEPIPAIVEQDREMLAAVKDRLERVRPSVVSVKGGGKDRALGVIVRSNGFILTKRSEAAKAGTALEVSLADGRTLPAREVHSFPDYDLALLKVDAAGLPVAEIPAAAREALPGNFLFTPGRTREMVAMGVTSVPGRSLREGGGYLGIGLGLGKDGVEVGEVVPDGPGAKAGLKKGDLLLELNGKAFKEADPLGLYVRSLSPSETLRVKYRSGTEEKTTSVVLGDRAEAMRKRPRNPATAIGTEVSENAGGYPVVFQHDQPLEPEHCGGVVLNLRGEIAGINIARAGRVDTYAIPALVVAALLSTVNFDALASRGDDHREGFE